VAGELRQNDLPQVDISEMPGQEKKPLPVHLVSTRWSPREAVFPVEKEMLIPIRLFEHQFQYEMMLHPEIISELLRGVGDHLIPFPVDPLLGSSRNPIRNSND